MKQILSMLAVVILITSCTKDSTVLSVPKPALTDIDGNKYDTVKICSQTWMKQNLTTTRLSNGDPIRKVIDSAEWIDCDYGAIPAYCYYNNDSAQYAAIYGKLYNWAAVAGIAPTGWHVPTHEEWTALGNCLGGNEVAGGKMKEVGTAHWITPNTGATNSSGFTALPGGYRFYDGLPFSDIGKAAYFWSTTKPGPSHNVIFRLTSFDNGILSWTGIDRGSGLSVRCIKD